MVVTNAKAPWADAPRFDYRLFKNPIKMSRSYRSVTVNLRKFLLSKSDAEKGGTTYVRHKDIPGTGGFVHEIPRLPRGHDYFIVVLYPPPDLEDEEFDGSEGGVDLLFDVNSLYYLGFSDAEYWRLFADAVLPGVTEESEAAMNIKRLHIKGSYQGIGQEYEDLIIGFVGQLETYKVLTNLRRENQARVERVSCRNIVTVSESMRFPFLQKLHLTAFEMGLEEAAMDYPVKAGEEYRNPSAHLNDWSNYSGKCSEGEDKFLAELRIQPIPGITSFECLLNFVSFLTNKDHEKAHRTEHSEKKSKNAIANRDGDKKGDGKKDPENEKDGRKQREKNNSSSTWFFESPVMPYRWISRYACLTKMVLPNKYAAVKFAQEFGIKVCSDLSLVPARVLPLPMLRYHNSGRQRTSVPSVGQWKMINKGKSEQMIEYIKKLRACIKWLLEREDANLAEIGKLTDLIDAAEKHHTESVAQLESRIEESLAIKEELQKQYAYLEENLKKLEAEKVDLLRSYGDEKEARTAVESSRNELNRVKLDKKRLNDQIKMLQDTNKRLQEYNTSLQQYNCNVQADAMKSAETIAKLQKEKNTMVDTMNSLKDHANSVKMQLDLAKNDLFKEADTLRCKLQQVREDRDHKSAEVNSLLSDLSAHKELTGKTSMEIENILTRCGALEETCSTQTERIKTLEIQLASANEKLKVCIFAYGQTGCGKTHTMMGNPEVHDQKGLIPRWLEQAFQTSQCPISQGWKYKMKAPMFEICNETIHDLLVTNRTSVQDGAASKYNIKHDDNGNTQVSELTVFDVGSINEVSSLLKRATQSRSVAKTQLNEESSRSHCVFTLRIFGVNEGTDQPMQGVVNLIDLAGSERLNKSGATGDRLKEIQPCLGGDLKTLCL